MSFLVELRLYGWDLSTGYRNVEGNSSIERKDIVAESISRILEEIWLVSQNIYRINCNERIVRLLG